MADHTQQNASAATRSEISVRSKTLARLAPTLKRLDSFDSRTRSQALAELAEEFASGGIERAPDKGWSNIHAHTIFSYSSEDYSPSRLAWEALMRGLTVIGSTDFDVLDALDEMLDAGDRLGVRSTVSLETRTFVDSYSALEMNSPGEPGILYSMGVGFSAKPSADSETGKFIASLAAQSRARNLEMIGRINPVTAPVVIDYERDVLPLTPAGNATERHICAAYDNKARIVFPEAESLAVFWADVLGRSPVDVEALLKDEGAFRNAVRAKLMKKGGAGYAQPDGGAFPAVAAFFGAVRAARAIPCHAWLDGMSPGEADPGKLLDDALSWGALCVNVIPERNWNISDPGAKAGKMAALDAFVKAARARDLPLLAGTEMNSPGQKFVDSFDAPELAPYVDDFQTAALWLYGHTVMERAAGMGVMSEWAERRFRSDRGQSRAFYLEIGLKARPGAHSLSRFASLNPDMTPEQALQSFTAN